MEAAVLFDTSTQSEDDESDCMFRRKKLKRKHNKPLPETLVVRPDQNVVLKVLNRQRFGHFSSDSRKRLRQPPFASVPPTLSFCLKDIVPFCYLEGQIFMGLSACGNFLISYKEGYDEEAIAQLDFDSAYNYTLFFWIYRPHFLLAKYFSVCLFDDHGTDGSKQVTMTQWAPDLIIVHGESENGESDSYVTLVRVPRLGCLDCKTLRDEYADGGCGGPLLCISCSMAVHTKYRGGENQAFDPLRNLNCPGFVVLAENTFIHSLCVELDLKRPRKVGSKVISERYIARRPPEDQTVAVKRAVVVEEAPAVLEAAPEQEQEEEEEENITIAEQIIRDFAEFEAKESDSERPSKASRPIDIPEVEISSPSRVRAATVEKNPYEFFEENEKCEKISTFRKRRLAEKRYEFSEDNNENILPFYRIRERVRSRLNNQQRAQSGVVSASPHDHLHLGSPSHGGFRSPCGSPVGSRYMKSPPAGLRSPNYRMNFASSPRPSIKRAAPDSSSLSVQTFASPGREDALRCLASPVPMRRPFLDSENCENCSSLGNTRPPSEVRSDDQLWKVNCSKRFTRCFAEEDDANSVVTMEEDDCISPGYHSSLPLEVHGSCYAEMQPISMASCALLKSRPAVVVTQHSFDVESLVVNVANHLCALAGKSYDMLSDSSYVILQICPNTFTITCLLQFVFSAFESAAYGTRSAGPLRKSYQVQTLFTWEMKSGHLDIIDYGKMTPIRGSTIRPLKDSLDRAVRRMSGRRSSSSSSSAPSDTHLRILTADLSKTKEKIVDLGHMIEFYRKNLNDPSDSSFSDTSDPVATDEEEPDDSDDVSE